MAKSLKFINVADFFSEMFHFSKGAKFAQLYTETVPDLPKKSPYYGLVTKKQSHNVQLNFSYSNAVNNMRLKEDKEADFVAAAPKWGTRIPGTPIIMHCKKNSTVTEAYLMTRVLKSAPSEYYLDGKFVDDVPTLDAIRGNMNKVYDNKAHQGVEKEVIIRTFKLSSIKAITIDGETKVVEK
jgi:hypothetical protein